MARYSRRRRYCRFTAEGVKEIDYKDINTLRQYVTETGKIVLSRITGTGNYPGFFYGHLLDRLQVFEMRGTGVGDDDHCRRGKPGQVFNFAELIHADFNNSKAIAVAQAKQRQRQTDSIVETVFGDYPALAST